jgi:hypothetical protein
MQPTNLRIVGCGILEQLRSRTRPQLRILNSEQNLHAAIQIPMHQIRTSEI